MTTKSADPTTYLSVSEGRYRVIHRGTPISADKKTPEEALAVADQFRLKVSDRIWDGDAGEWVSEEWPPLQESSMKKDDWLRAAKRRFPVDSRVRVKASDVAKYVGKYGTVVGYDLGTRGDWPLVKVELDNGARDAFYGDGASDDEIVPVKE